MNLVTLLTDFPYGDPYVGMMKGVILTVNPRARIVDLAHGLPAHNVQAAAFVLARSVRYFPGGTVHVAVVDPGVGGRRRAVAVRVDGAWLVGPDNGVLSLAAGVVTGARRVYEITGGPAPFPRVGRTFDGRDLFAPVAARLSLGRPLGRFGSPVDGMKRLALPRPGPVAGGLRGEVVYVDGYGNLVTNLRRADSAGSPVFTVGRMKVKGIARSYEEVPVGSPVAVEGGFGYLEISVREGSATHVSGAGLGSTVTLRSPRR